MTRGPDFIVIGAMKSATSTLHEQLAAQPGFCMSEPKEPNFFSDDENYRAGLDGYLSLFASAAPGDLCGESSTHYSKLPTYPHTIERILRHVPDVKLVYMMRHPLDRLVSHYVHEWTQNVIRGDIDRALVEHPEMIDYGRYSMQLRPYFDAFGAQRVHPMFMERLLAHPQEELERLCRFLGYAGTPRWVDDLQAANVSSERLRASPLRDMLVYAPVVSQIRTRLVPKRLRSFIKGFWQMRERPRLSPGSMRRAREAFDADLARLGGWLGVGELHCDNYRGVVTEQALGWTAGVLSADY